MATQTEYDVEKIKQVVLDFVKKKWKELGAVGKQFHGIYHDGVYGVQSPKREVWIGNGSEGKISVDYFCGERGWNFQFSETEYKPPSP